MSLTQNHPLKKGVLMNMPVELSQENKSFATLLEYIKQIHDPRMQKKITYPLSSIIVISLCAFIAGSNNCVEIAQYAKERKQWLKKYFNIECGFPSHDTINRVFSLINPKEFNYWMTKWLKSLFPESDVINIDGKVIKSYSSNDPLTLVRAWSSNCKIVLAQIKVSYDSNEITAIPKLLDMLDLKGKIITIDAIGTQKKITAQLVDKEAYYCLALKGNQHLFYQDIKLFLDSMSNSEFENVNYTYYETFDTAHGRRETRRCWSTNNISWLEQMQEWKGLRSISVVESTVIKNGKTSINRRYFISNLEADASNILRIIRSHWSIENQLHWHLDVTLNEDKSSIKGIFVSQNISLLRSIIISLLSLLPIEAGFNRKRQTVNRRPSLLKKILLKSG